MRDKKYIAMAVTGEWSDTMYNPVFIFNTKEEADKFNNEFDALQEEINKDLMSKKLEEAWDRDDDYHAERIETYFYNKYKLLNDIEYSIPLYQIIEDGVIILIEEVEVFGKQ